MTLLNCAGENYAHILNSLFDGACDSTQIRVGRDQFGGYCWFAPQRQLFWKYMQFFDTVHASTEGKGDKGYH